MSVHKWLCEEFSFLGDSLVLPNVSTCHTGPYLHRLEGVVARSCVDVPAMPVAADRRILVRPLQPWRLKVGIVAMSRLTAVTPSQLSSAEFSSQQKCVVCMERLRGP